MFIRFMQQMEKEEPLLSQEDLLDRWKRLQATKASIVFAMLELMRKK